LPSSRTSSTGYTNRPFLVIVPLSTITAWQTQFQAYINIITYIGTAIAREIIRLYEFGPSNKKLKMNVLQTTYELTLRDAKELGDIKWQALAVDEVIFAICVLILVLI
jgi:chromodomain-helicase-DNA-binding protein 1